MSGSRRLPPNAPVATAPERRRESAAAGREPEKAGSGRRGKPAAGASGRYAALLTSIFLVAASAASFLATVTFRTPLSKLADTSSASISGGNRNERRKAP